MRKKLMFTTSKLVVSGNIFEIYNFKKAIWQGSLPQQPPLTGRQRGLLENGKRSESSIFRAKRNLKRLIDSNIFQEEDEKLLPRFVTFTFKENMTDIKKANSEFTNFIRRFNYSLGFKRGYLKYATVIEFQKRGAIHYHTIFFNLPFIKRMYDKMRDLWKNGWVISKKIDSVRSVSAYVCKYMSKESSDIRLYGRKCYFTSRNLKKSRTIYNQSIVDFVSASIPEEIEFYEKIIPSHHCEEIKYQRYDLEKHQALKNDLLAIIG